MRTYRLLVLVVLSLLTITTAVHAQSSGGRSGGRGFSLLNFSYEFLAPSAAEGLDLAANQNMEVEVTTLAIKFNLPPIGMRGRGRSPNGGKMKIPRWMILHSLDYHQRRADYHNLNTSSGIAPLDRVNGFEYKMNLVLGLSRKWRCAVQLTPGLYSDLEGDINADHWKVQSAMLLDRVFDSGLTMGLGASWSTAFGENMLLPIFHLETRRGINPHVRVMAPMLAEVTWSTELGIEIGGAVRVDGGQYGLGEFMSPGGSSRIDKLRYTNVTAGPFVAFRMGSGLSLMLEGGGTLYRRFETWKAETRIEDYELKNASFFRIGLRAGI